MVSRRNSDEFSNALGSRTQGSEKISGLTSMGLEKAIVPLRVIGYGLLAFALADWLDLLLPANFLNPQWEFETIGSLVERVPVPLIGFLLVFLGGQYEDNRMGQVALKVLSWLALLIAVLYFLMVPLGTINTVRIDRQNNLQLSTQVTQNMTEIQQVKSAIAQTNSPAELATLLSRLNSAGLKPDIQTNQQVEQVKSQLSQFIAQSESRLRLDAEKLRSQQRFNLVKKSVKWNGGALLAGCLFVSLWRGTHWARSASR